MLERGTNLSIIGREPTIVEHRSKVGPTRPKFAQKPPQFGRTPPQFGRNPKPKLADPHQASGRIMGQRHVHVLRKGLPHFAKLAESSPRCEHELATRVFWVRHQLPWPIAGVGTSTPHAGVVKQAPARRHSARVRGNPKRRHRRQEWGRGKFGWIWGLFL